MKRNVFWLALGCVILAGVGPARAQEDESRGVQRLKDARAAQAALTPARYLQLIEKLQKDTMQTLKPEEELTSDLRAVFAKYVREVREQVDAERDLRREIAEESRELMRELKESRADGDNERAKEVREELTELRRNKQEAEYVHQDLIDEVRDLLPEGDIEDFDRLAEVFEQHLNRSSDSSGDKLSVLGKVIMTLQISPEQRVVMLEIINDAKREAAEVKGDQEKTDAVFEAARDNIREELNDEQADVLDQRLEKALKRKDSRRAHPVPERKIEPSAAPKPEEADDEEDEEPEPAEPPTEEDSQ